MTPVAADTCSFEETALRLGFGRATLERHLGVDDSGREVVVLDCGTLPVVRIGRARRIPVAQVEFLAANGRPPASVAELAEFIRALRGAA